MKSTEERELEKIEALRKELEAKRKLAQESHKSTKTSTGYVPPQSKQPLTKPDELHFATDERIKNVQDKSDSKEINFTKILRQNRLRTVSVFKSRKTGRKSTTLLLICKGSFTLK